MDTEANLGGENWKIWKEGSLRWGVGGLMGGKKDCGFGCGIIVMDMAESAYERCVKG